MNGFFAVTLGFVLGVLIPIGFFLFEWLIERKSHYVTLTPFKHSRDPAGNVIVSQEEVDFDPRLGHYLKVGEVLVTLGAASIVFIPSLHSASVLHGLPFALVLLALSVVYALLFMALLTYFYEMFLFDPTNFTARKSSLVFSLGFSAFACFAIAYVVIACELGKAVAAGKLPLHPLSLIAR